MVLICLKFFKPNKMFLYEELGKSLVLKGSKVLRGYSTKLDGSNFTVLLSLGM